MCIDSRAVLKADKPLEVYKVMRDNKEKSETPFMGIPEDKLTTEDAVDFDYDLWPRGYCVFNNRETAEKYNEIIKRILGGNLLIKKYVIPEGSRYSYGFIHHPCVGGGLPAIRCERLKK